MIEPESVERWLGVDIGENVLFAAACVGGTSGELDHVEMESGREYRHHRERLKTKRDKLGQKGDLRGVKQCKGDIENYTDWVLHTASKRIVDIAVEHTPCGIRLEDLTDLRSSVDDPIHDWPYAEFQKNIVYKATTAGIPVEIVDPAVSSQKCNRCGQRGVREGIEFSCGDAITRFTRI